MRKFQFGVDLSVTPLYLWFISLFKRDPALVATITAVKFFVVVIVFIFVMAFYSLQELLIFYL